MYGNECVGLKNYHATAYNTAGSHRRAAASTLTIRPGGHRLVSYHEEL